MALGRLSVCTGAKGKASAHAQYIAREGKYAKDPTIEKLEHAEIGNMPKWAESDPNFFWQMSDEHERKNGSTYREHVITLPRELNESQRLALIHDWIKQEIGDKFAYQFAIHNPKAMDGKEQPHCHLMFSERTIDGIERDPDQYFRRYNAKNPERGGAKKANTGIAPADRKAELSEQRDRWERMCNSHLELANRKARISMKSLKDRGYKRQPVNLTMAQIQTPKIRAVYLDSLEAKRMYIAALKDRKKIDIPTELEMQERQKRLADIMKLREAAQQKTAQEAEKVAQAKQEAMEKAAERQRIEKRKPSDMLNKLGARVQIVDADRYGNITTTYKDTTAIISANLHKLIKNGIAKNKEIVITNTDYRGEQVNPEYAQNNTAKAFERFMLQKNVLNDPRILIDFGLGKESLGIRDFAEKYNIKCDFHDLEKLDSLNPVAEPQLTEEKPTQPKAEQKPQVDSSYDNSPNYP